MNHKILSLVDMPSSCVNIEPIPPIIENVRTINTIAVIRLTSIFLDNDKKLSALDHNDCALLI